MNDAWGRAVAAEKRRCDRLGFIFCQPDSSCRCDEYRIGDLVELVNVNGVIATYQVGPTGRVTRKQDSGISKRGR